MDIASQTPTDGTSEKSVAATVARAPLSTFNPTPELSYRAKLIQRASAQIPFTAEGLPVGYYRADLLPGTTPSEPTEEIQALKNAYVDLSFDHGYPTLADSRPFWHKLDFEPGFAFGAFQIYLELINEGPREISLLSDNEELLMLASRANGLPEGQMLPKAQLGRIINEFAIIYCWRARAQAQDIYKEAAYRHLRLRRQMTMEDEHFKVADKLLKKLKNEVFEGGDAFWAEMSPKTAVDLYKAAVAIQRVSVGLPAAGPLSQKETPDAVTFEMIMRQLAPKMGNVYENGQNQVHGARDLLDTVLKDPDAATSLQEVIIRVTSAQQNGNQLANPHEGAQARRFKGRPSRQTTQEHAISGEDLLPFDMSGAPGENLDGKNEREMEPVPVTIPTTTEKP